MGIEALKNIGGALVSGLGGLDWAGIAGEVAGAGAPILGSILGGAVGGPMGATLGNKAGQMIAEALGVDATPQAVSTAIETDPAAVEKIKQLEAEHKDDLEQVKAQMEDAQNARQMEVAFVQAGSKLSLVPPILSAIIIVGYFVNIGALYFLSRDVPPNVLSLLQVSFGTLSGAFVQVLNYWFGTSRSSEKNGEMVRNIAGAGTGVAIPTDRAAAAPVAVKKRKMLF